MSNSKITKSCKNCVFYVQLYSLSDGCVNATPYGRCMNFRSSGKDIVTKTDVCKSWVFMRVPKIVSLKEIEYKMYFMAQKLLELSDELGEARKKRK